MCNLVPQPGIEPAPCNRSLKSQPLDRQGSPYLRKSLSQGSPYLRKVPISTILFRTYSLSQKKNQHQLITHSSIPPCPHPWKSLICILSPWIFHINIWIIQSCGLLCLAFSLNIVFLKLTHVEHVWVFPLFCFYVWIIFYYINKPHFVCPFISW